MCIHLSPRLRAIGEKVPPGARAIDVGTDHGMIPVWLIQTGRAAHVWATDIREGPLQGAARLISETGTGEGISLRLTDGLQGLGPADGDTIVIAGMGGETMVSILSQAPWTKEGPLLILSPHTKGEVLRSWLGEQGYEIQTESLVEDGKRIYPIMTVRGGRPLEHSPAELYTGAYEKIQDDPLFEPWLQEVLGRVRKGAPYDKKLKEVMDGCLEMSRRHERCRQ